jgi:hypothetical protein
MLNLNGTRSAHPCAVNTRRRVVLTEEEGVAPPNALIGAAPFRQDVNGEHKIQTVLNRCANSRFAWKRRRGPRMQLKEQLRQSMLGDISALHENLERVWKIAQALPAGGTRDDLENTHHRLIKEKPESLNPRGRRKEALFGIEDLGHTLRPLGGNPVIGRVARALNTASSILPSNIQGSSGCPASLNFCNQNIHDNR